MNSTQELQNESAVQVTNETSTNKNTNENTNEQIYCSYEIQVIELKMLHYKTCDNFSESFVKECRGIVKHNEDIIMKTTGYIDEYNVGTDDLVLEQVIKTQLQDNPLTDCTIHSLYEGTVIRLFFWQNQWRICTHKKLNAFESRWGNSNCLSFGEMFTNGLCKLSDSSIKIDNWNFYDKLNQFCFALNTERNYVFLVIHDSNSTMICNNQPTFPLYHVAEFNKHTHQPINENTTSVPSIPSISCEFTTVQDLLQMIETTIDPSVSPGAMLTFPNGFQIKIFSSKYRYLNELRSNQPDILYRFLEIRQSITPTYNRYQELWQHFPQHRPLFQKAEEIIYSLVCLIHDAYKTRYINKQFVFIPKIEYEVLQNCHKWHCENRKGNIVTAMVVYSQINSLPVSTLYKLVKQNL
jgi:hypothetical protein